MTSIRVPAFTALATRARGVLMPMDYSRFDVLEVSDDDDDDNDGDEGAMLCIPDQDGIEATCYRHRELRGDQPWRAQCPQTSEAQHNWSRSTSGQPSIATASKRPQQPLPQQQQPQPPQRPQQPQQQHDQTSKGIQPPQALAAPHAALHISSAELESAGVAHCLERLAQIERIRLPAYSYEQTRGSARQMMFTAQCEWAVSGKALVVSGAAQVSKKLARAAAAHEMLVACQHHDLVAIG